MVIFHSNVSLPEGNWFLFMFGVHPRLMNGPQKSKETILNKYIEKNHVHYALVSFFGTPAVGSSITLRTHQTYLDQQKRCWIDGC